MKRVINFLIKCVCHRDLPLYAVALGILLGSAYLASVVYSRLYEHCSDVMCMDPMEYVSRDSVFIVKVQSLRREMDTDLAGIETCSSVGDRDVVCDSLRVRVIAKYEARMLELDSMQKDLLVPYRK